MAKNSEIWLRKELFMTHRIKAHLVICGFVGLLNLLFVGCSSVGNAKGQVKDYLAATYGKESGEYKVKMQELDHLVDGKGTDDEKIAKINQMILNRDTLFRHRHIPVEP